MSSKKIGELMKLSADLSNLNFERYQQFSSEFNTNNAKQAILAFTGAVYRGLDANNFNENELDFAQSHLRILSGLYGILKPLDLMQPYRLEMGTRLQISAKEKNLYAFWKETNTKKLNQELNGKPLVNLASNEYFKSVDTKKINSDILTLNFKDNKNGEYKTIMTYAKTARGYMANYIIKNQLKNINDIKSFDIENYSFNDKLSTELDWTFTRG